MLGTGPHSSFEIILLILHAFNLVNFPCERESVGSPKGPPPVPKENWDNKVY